MKRAASLAMIILVAMALVPPPRAAAQDASFGCKVLLCAAATSPNWSGIPYCVPAMQQLFRSLAHGGGWPTCPEGHTNGLGYEPFQACPAGMTAVQQSGDSGAFTPAPNGNMCMDMSHPQQTCSGGDSSCSSAYPTTMREPRAHPYYVDIGTGNGSQRFYFSLQGY